MVFGLVFPQTTSNVRHDNEVDREMCRGLVLVIKDYPNRCRLVEVLAKEDGWSCCFESISNA